MHEVDAIAERIEKAKDVYQVFALGKEASLSDFKKSYRKLTHLFYPDFAKSHTAHISVQRKNTITKILTEAYQSVPEVLRRKQETSSSFFNWEEYSKKAKPDNGLNTPQDHIFFYSNDYQVFMIKTAVKLKKQIYQFITSSLNKTNKFFSPGSTQQLNEINKLILKQWHLWQPDLAYSFYADPDSILLNIILTDIVIYTLENLELDNMKQDKMLNFKYKAIQYFGDVYPLVYGALGFRIFDNTRPYYRHYIDNLYNRREQSLSSFEYYDKALVRLKFPFSENYILNRFEFIHSSFRVYKPANILQRMNISLSARCEYYFSSRY